jgi:UDP-glucuronate decarboxylase
MVKGLRSLAEASSWVHGPVNLGNDGEFTMIELAETLSEWFPRLLVVNEPLPQDDPRVRRPDLSLAKSKLRYAPTVSLREGLDKTISWMRDRKLNSRA